PIVAGRGQGQNRRRITKKNKNKDIDVNQIECLPPASTENLIKKVRAAIYLSLDKLWEMLNETSLIATVLDPRMKNFSFANSHDCIQQRTQAEFLLRILYNQLKKDSVNSENIEEHISTAVNLNDNNTEDVFTKI
ncbi:17368_t:CDS:2, partial [Dentiscutata heterogama]